MHLTETGSPHAAPSAARRSWLWRVNSTGDSALDDRFLTEMKSRYGDKIKLKSLDFSGRFKDWETAIRYAEVIRHHDPYHFEQPSRDMRVSAEFVRRVDLPVTWQKELYAE